MIMFMDTLLNISEECLVCKIEMLWDKYICIYLMTFERFCLEEMEHYPGV